MFKQLYFPGLEPRPPRDNLFFGILSPANSAIEISKAADDLRNLYGLNGRLIAQERLHVSLHAVGLFDGPPNFIVERAREAGELVSTSPFRLMFDRIMSFDIKRDKRPLVLRPRHDLASLFTLHDVLGEAMKRARIGRYVVSRFVPHMTLLYDRRVIRERRIEPIQMNVQDFVLVHSLIGQSRYIELARWPLRG